MGKLAHEQVVIVETKDCAFCYKLIDVRAQRCPYCCSAQTRPPKYEFGVIGVVLGLVAVMAAGAAAFSWLQVLDLRAELDAVDAQLVATRADLDKIRNAQISAEGLVEPATPAKQSAEPVEEMPEQTQNQEQTGKLEHPVQQTPDIDLLLCENLVSNVSCYRGLPQRKRLTL